MTVYVLEQGYGDYREVGDRQDDYRRVIGIFTTPEAAMQKLPSEWRWDDRTNNRWWNGRTNRSIEDPAYITRHEVQGV